MDAVERGALEWSHVPIQFSLDGCRTVVTWSPVTLPKKMIQPAAKPGFCGAPGEPRCATLDFQGDRLPRYSDVAVDAGGRIKFRVRSKAFIGVESLRVTSPDAGKTWRIEPQAAAASNSGRFAPDSPSGPHTRTQNG